MRKYYAIAKASIVELAAYPSRFLSSFFIHAVALLFIMLVWSAVYKNRSSVEGYTFTNLVSYMALSLIIRELTASGKVAQSISKHIRRGDLANLLRVPVNFNLYLAARSVSQRAFTVLLPIALLTIATILGSQYFPYPQNFGFFILSLALAVILNYFMYAVIGSVGFWSVSVWGFISLYGRVADVLNGSVFPLDFLPLQLMQIVDKLPFKYMHYAPLSIYLGRVGDKQAIQTIIIQIVWLIIIGTIYKIVWSKGIKKFDSVGG